ncbi:CD209 antigen-like protein E isoform X2 [Embiotoca jacksoni]|uniref:CD209 antigen-like protein E isoform X2 n=1 Tax=Embiotoca jacksoni TaxID=100190 RepID=UPI00370407DE
MVPHSLISTSGPTEPGIQPNIMDYIYANAEELSGRHSKWKRKKKTSENIYSNEDVIQTLKSNRSGPARSGAEVVKKSSCRAAAVFLGLLCLLLLTGLMTMVFLFTHSKSQWETEMALLQDSYNNLTSERNELQTSYNSLAEDQDQLTKQKEDLQRKFQDCQQFRVDLDNSSYFISTSQKTWQESREDCQKRGADLVIINSKGEQEFMRQFRRLNWIGLTDTEKEGTWKWVDGTKLNASYWGPNEPNGSQDKDEDCAEMWEHDSANNWNDAPCNLHRFWICEKRLAS